MDYIKQLIKHFKDNDYQEGESIAAYAATHRGFLKRAYGLVIVTNLRLIIYPTKAPGRKQQYPCLSIKDLQFNEISGLDWFTLTTSKDQIKFSIKEQESSLEVMTALEMYRQNKVFAPLPPAKRAQLKRIVLLAQGNDLREGEYQQEKDLVFC